MAGPTDRDLVAYARSGDKRAFGELVERHHSMCIRLALRMVNDEETAQELVQEATLQAFLSLDHLRDDGSFGSWLGGIVLNLCRGHLRDEKPSVSWESLAGGVHSGALWLHDEAPDPSDVVEHAELHEVLHKAVDALSPKSRAAARLFYLEGRTLQEIADALGATVGTVKGRLYRARERLRERLTRLYGELNGERVLRRKEQAMIPLTIADVVMQKERKTCVVVLHDAVGHRLLPVWIGMAEGEAIALGVRNYPLPRPTTHTLMVKLLEATGLKIERVRIESLKDMTYYAVVKLSNGAEVDARPSDALALAVRTDSPVCGTEDVMENAAVAIPTEHWSKPPLGAGVDAIVTEIEAKAVRTKEAELREVVAFVFEGNVSVARGEGS